MCVSSTLKQTNFCFESHSETNLNYHGSLFFYVVMISTPLNKVSVALCFFSRDKNYSKTRNTTNIIKEKRHYQYLNHNDSSGI